MLRGSSDRQGAGPFSDVKKQLFWMSLTELADCKMRLDPCLCDQVVPQKSIQWNELSKSVLFKQLATEVPLAEQSLRA